MIETICSSLGKTAGPESLSEDAVPLDCSPSHFRPATEMKIHKLPVSSPCNPYELDPSLTWLLRMHAVPMVLVLTQLVSTSLSEGYVDSCLKVAHV